MAWVNKLNSNVNIEGSFGPDNQICFGKTTDFIPMIEGLLPKTVAPEEVPMKVEITKIRTGSFVADLLYSIDPKAR